MQGQKVAFRMHENAEKKWCCGADETLISAPPGPPIWLERARAGRPGPGGWGTGLNQPPRLTVSLFAVFPNQLYRSPISSCLRQFAQHAALGAADFPCLRQLPPPPFKRRNQRVAGRRRRFQGAKITFRLHERQRPSCEGPKCFIFPHTHEQVDKTMQKP